MPEGHHDASREGQATGLEELCATDLDYIVLKIDVCKRQAYEFANSQPGTVGKQDHHVKAESTERRSMELERTRYLKQMHYLCLAINIWPPLVLLDTTSRVTISRKNFCGVIEPVHGLRQRSTD